MQQRRSRGSRRQLRPWPEHEHLVIDDQVLINGVPFGRVEVCDNPRCLDEHPDTGDWAS